jgi:predicted MPP superfamily phosphohydrolase
MTAEAQAPRSPRLAPRRHSDLRIAFFKNVERAFRLCGGRRAYRALYLARGRFVEREEELRVPGLPAALDGFLVAHLSDLHGGPFVGRGALADVVAAVNDRRPDLCALTGDFITRHWREVLPLVDDLARLDSRHGSYAVFGNHDYKQRLEQNIVEALGEVGVRFLRNDGARIELDGAALHVTGLEDLEEGKVVDLAAARRGLRPEDVELVLCHNPLGAPALTRPGCAAILSGHTHGAQIDLPLMRKLGPQHPGLRVDMGTSTLIVSRGLGAIGVPVRIGAPAELVWVRLVAAPRAEERER